MDTATKVIVGDAGMGSLWVGFGVYTAAAPFDQWWWIAALAAVTAAVGAYGLDHGLVGFGTARQGRRLVVGFLSVVAGAGALVFATGLAVQTVAASGLAGLGAGLLAYRVVYGVVLPVPAARLDAVRERVV